MRSTIKKRILSKRRKLLLKFYVKWLENPIKKPTQKLFRVQVGAFSTKQNAESMMKQLQKTGYDAYIPN